MGRYRGQIKLVILDIAGTVCDGPQDLRHIYPNDDGLAVKGPVIVFERMFSKFRMELDWATIRKPMGKFKKEHLEDILSFPHVREKFRVTPTSDTWFLAMARASSASRTLAPLAWDNVGCSGGICSPSGSRAWGVTNAILVDGDGSGAYDDFPLKPTQPLNVSRPPVALEAPRVPSPAEFDEWLRKLLHH